MEETIINDIEFIPQAQFGDPDKFEIKYTTGIGVESSKMISKRQFDFLQYHLNNLIRE